MKGMLNYIRVEKMARARVQEETGDTKKEMERNCFDTFERSGGIEEDSRR